MSNLSIDDLIDDKIYQVETHELIEHRGVIVIAFEWDADARDYLRDSLGRQLYFNEDMRWSRNWQCFISLDGYKLTLGQVKSVQESLGSLVKGG